jgi:hypothetical protein
MTPLALPGETVDDAIKRISTLQIPKRPTSKDLLRQEMTRSKSALLTSRQDGLAGIPSPIMSPFSFEFPRKPDARSVSPVQAEELSPRQNDEKSAGTFSSYSSFTGERLESTSASRKHSSPDGDAAPPPKRSGSVYKHRRIDGITMNREESKLCKSISVPCVNSLDAYTSSRGQLYQQNIAASITIGSRGVIFRTYITWFRFPVIRRGLH